MRHIIFAALLASVLVLPSASPAWAHGFRGAGHFQHLDLMPGGHHIDVGAPGFQSLSFDTYIQPGHTTDYKTNMVPVVGPNQ